MDAALVGHRDRLAFHAQLRKGGDGGGGVAGYIDLRHHLDVAGSGVGNDVGDLFLGVVAAVRARLSAGRIDAGIAAGDAAAADLGQARVFPDLDAPALVVGQVPVEDVELVQGHRVEHALDLVHAVEVPGRIEHVAAPAKARRVLDPQRGHRGVAAGLAGGGLDQLPQRDRTVVQAGRVAGDQVDVLFVDGQAVAFGGDVQGRIKREPDARGRVGGGGGGRRGHQLQAGGARQQVGELAGDLGRGRVAIAQGGIGSQAMVSRRDFDPCRHRDQRQWCARDRPRGGLRGGGRGGGQHCQHGQKPGQPGAGASLDGSAATCVRSHSRVPLPRCRPGRRPASCYNRPQP